MGFIDVVRNSRREAENGRLLDERRRDTDTIPLIHRRLAVKAIDEVVFNLTKVDRARELRAMRLSGIEQIGSGAESIVLKIGDTAVKYAKGSERIAESERLALAAKKENQFDALADFLEPYLLDQSVTVADHPFRKNKRAVQTYQPYIKFLPGVIRQSSIDGNRVALSPDTPLDQLSDFVDAAWHFYGRTDLLIDTNGVDNIVVADDQLILLDTQPIGPEFPETRRLILEQLDLLGDYLK